MVTPRCNFPDLVNGTPIKQGVKLVQNPFNNSYYAFLGSRWPMSKYNLTWDIADSKIKSKAITPLTLAFKKWEDDSVLSFRRASSFKSADVKIKFFRFEGKDTAHAYPPPSGELNFNAKFSWGDGTKPDRMDLESIGLHEIGHILGLDHSSDLDAVMWPYLKEGMIKRVLNFDDLLGIHILYE
ncbi:metalloendoproteinase 3-MMP-like [Impatiens glandulifera]|uniref:metalloendoproteinase 3-MMP-like n=1 Tax=Impatiens glandulifera TaxID=253017 RepID=UPI001FB18914|nr:metalloendoproteinase 3-MMP-like [Impatiens glandulifera]